MKVHKIQKEGNNKNKKYLRRKLKPLEEFTLKEGVVITNVSTYNIHISITTTEDEPNV